MGRQERRVRLKQSVEAVSRSGMDLTASGSDQSWAVIAATRILLDIIETSLKRNPSKYPVACAKGCAFCCHVSVTATAPEIFLVANALRERHRDNMEAIIARVRAADERTRGLSSMERAKQRIPCALLEENMCSVYGSRPAACRGFSSTSVQVCERGFNGEDVQINTPAVWTSLRSAHKQALWAALAAAKLPSALYEFHHALRIALEMPDTELRWLKGEDVFAGVAREVMNDPVVDANNQRIIDTLIAGALGKELP
jgi:Fe-S-cluster containining protein